MVNVCDPLACDRILKMGRCPLESKGGNSPRPKLDLCVCTILGKALEEMRVSVLGDCI